MDTDRPEITMDDIVETPYGDAQVVGIDWQREMFAARNLDTGIVLEWKNSEVETMAQPDPSDPEAIERWLGIAAVIVPSLDVSTRTVRCIQIKACRCRFCYRVVKEITGRNVQTRTEISHFTDADACHCIRMPGSRNRDCVCLNDVTVRFVP